LHSSIKLGTWLVEFIGVVEEFNLGNYQNCGV